MKETVALPADLAELLHPGMVVTDAKYYLKRKAMIEQNANQAIQRAHKNQQQNVKRNQNTARFLYVFSCIVFLGLLVFGKNIIVLSLITVMPILTLAVGYSVYGAVVLANSFHNKAGSIELKKQELIDNIKPTNDDVRIALKELDDETKEAAMIIEMGNDALVNICCLGITYVDVKRPVLWSITYEEIAFYQQDAMTEKDVRQKKNNEYFWGLDREKHKTEVEGEVTAEEDNDKNKDLIQRAFEHNKDGSKHDKDVVELAFEHNQDGSKKTKDKAKNDSKSQDKNQPEGEQEESLPLLHSIVLTVKGSAEVLFLVCANEQNAHRGFMEIKQLALQAQQDRLDKSS
jgi:hypothetical protein